jgi:hypothetical protein
VDEAKARTPRKEQIAADEDGMEGLSRPGKIRSAQGRGTQHFDRRSAAQGMRYGRKDRTKELRLSTVLPAI